MYVTLKNCFRKDLIVTDIADRETLAKRYLIKDPNSGETLEFGEEEYFLCKSMDGTSTPAQIVTDFQNRFGLSLTEADFIGFSQQIAEFGFLEPFQGKVPSPASLASEQQNLPPPSNRDLTPVQPENLEEPTQKPSPKRKKGPLYLWTLPNPDAKFVVLASLFAPFSLFFKVLVWGLIPGLPIAFFTFFNNQSVFWRDITSSVEALPYLTTYIFNVIFVSLSAKIAQGIVCVANGGSVNKFGLVLAAGFFPRFYMAREGVWQLNRQQQLWAFATPLVDRLIYFALAVLVWYWTRSTGTELGTWALLLAHASFLDFLLDACPLLPVDGYFFAVTYFRLPANFLARVYLVWEMVIQRRPLPEAMSAREKWGLLVYGPMAVIFWLSMVLVIAYSIATGLAENFPGVFGRATGAILIGTLIVAALRQPIAFFFKKKGRTSPSDRVSHTGTSVLAREPVKRQKKPYRWLKRGNRLLLLLCFSALLFVPYPYRPGGQVELLPPTQQEIQAQVDGKITKVMFEGANGQWIKAGTVIAQMEAVDIENTVLTTQEEVRQQQATLEKAQANLNKLLAMPKKEDVDVAKQQVEVARQEVEVAKQQVKVAKGQLKTAISKAEFSAREAARYKELYETGAFSLQQYENSQKDAETDRNTVEELKQKVEEEKRDVTREEQSLQTAKANLELVMSGPFPEEIEAARKEVEAARASLKRFQQQLKYNQDELNRTPLVMPIDGQLITPYLDRKVGSYLDQGDTYAVAEDNRRIRGEVRIPEYNVGEFAVGRTVELKLLAYPEKSLLAKVTAIEPTASDDSDDFDNRNAEERSVSIEQESHSSDRYVRVIVDLPNTDKLLKAGMSGYAKIEGRKMPLIVAFTRPIVRFIQIEIWSWLP